MHMMPAVVDWEANAVYWHASGDGTNRSVLTTPRGKTVAKTLAEVPVALAFAASGRLVALLFDRQGPMQAIASPRLEALSDRFCVRLHTDDPVGSTIAWEVNVDLDGDGKLLGIELLFGGELDLRGRI